VRQRWAGRNQVPFPLRQSPARGPWPAGRQPPCLAARTESAEREGSGRPVLPGVRRVAIAPGLLRRRPDRRHDAKLGRIPEAARRRHAKSEVRACSLPTKDGGA
jgi:hypothetical protein